MRWRNWAGNVVADPAAMRVAGSEGDLVRILVEARDAGLGVRAVGTGHSFAPICATQGVLVSLQDRNACRVADDGLAALWAGTKIGTAAEALWGTGRSFANQGDIDVQSMAGAISTGTHGTGTAYGSFSERTAALRLVTAAGDVLEIDGSREPQLLRAAALSVGMLGLVSEIRMRTVPRYHLRERTRDVAVDECAATFDEVGRQHRNAEFYWVPRYDRCVLKTLDPAHEAEGRVEHEGELPPPGTLERYLRPERVDRAYRVFRNIRTVPFLEMEYSVPLAAGPRCFAEIRALMRRKFPDKTWVVEYRTQAADDLLLSPAYRRAVATISVHDEPGASASEAYFRACEAILLAHDGRPHWGKLCFLGPGERADRFPEFESFAAVRQRLDPDGVFLNDALRPLFR